MRKTTISIIALLLLGAAPATSFAAYGIQIKTSGCIANQVLPDPACTPGAVLTTNEAVICKVGYTTTVRDVSTATKKKVFQEYGIPWAQRSNYEVDHLISLELGGSNDISNLFPESHLIKNNSYTKDAFENYLHKQICTGKLSITDAQYQIATDWATYNTARLNPTKPTAVKTGTMVAPPKTTTPQIVAPPALVTPTVTPVPNATSTAEPAVKKSTTGLCHAKGSTYYNQTKNYTAYATVADCLASGGRLPAR